MTVDLDVEHVWAPETYYDAATSQYLVYWSSPIDTNPSAADARDIYSVRTTDFEILRLPRSSTRSRAKVLHRRHDSRR